MGARVAREVVCRAYGMAVCIHIEVDLLNRMRNVSCHRHPQRFGQLAVATQHDGCIRPSGRCVKRELVQNSSILRTR